MSDSDTNLSALRRKIDGFDNQLLDLLMSRAATAREIGQAKRGTATWRPSREAQVLRRLVSRLQGPFPACSVIQIWREIMSAVAGLQSPQIAAVYTPGNDHTCHELARDHFGVTTPVFGCSTPEEVIEGVRSGRATVGVLPKPGDSADVIWWAALAQGGKNRLIICADLPFSPVPAKQRRAFCIAAIKHEESGKDRSLFVVKAPKGVDQSALETAMRRSNLAACPLGEPAECGDKNLFLFEIEGFVSPRAEPKLDVPDTTVICLGGYAVPFSAAEFSYQRVD